MRRKLSKKHSEIGNTGAERYLITYADLITLLLGLFVILYASSRLDTEKFQEFSNAFSEYFNKPGVLEGGSGILEGEENTIPEPIFPQSNGRTINEISIETESALRTYIDNGTIEIKKNNGGFTIVLPEKFLFPSASSALKEQGLPLLDTLGQVLSGISQQITVDGHTDSDPINSFRFESNWHLSLIRALNVADELIESGMPEENLIIRGFGSKKPVSDNVTVEGKAKNRRVEITILEKNSESPSSEGYLEKNKTENI